MAPVPGEPDPVAAENRENEGRRRSKMKRIHSLLVRRPEVVRVAVVALSLVAMALAGIAGDPWGP